MTSFIEENAVGQQGQKEPRCKVTVRTHQIEGTHPWIFSISELLPLTLALERFL